MDNLVWYGNKTMLFIPNLWLCFTVLKSEPLFKLFGAQIASTLIGFNWMVLTLPKALRASGRNAGCLYQASSAGCVDQLNCSCYGCRPIHLFEVFQFRRPYRGYSFKIGFPRTPEAVVGSRVWVSSAGLDQPVNVFLVVLVPVPNSCWERNRKFVDDRAVRRQTITTLFCSRYRYRCRLCFQFFVMVEATSLSG